jgi:hypothetical protein
MVCTPQRRAAKGGPAYDFLSEDNEMGKVYPLIDDSLREFIEQQRVFFVATAPLDADGHINVSPKGVDALKVIDPNSVAYLDHVGSGAETIAHLRENGRIVIMVCAFEGPPKIVRLHGRGEVFEPQDAGHVPLRSLFTSEAAARSIIQVSVERISDSCGFGVPMLAFQSDRRQLSAWASRKAEEEGGLESYQREKNATSIDGLPALRWADCELT